MQIILWMWIILALSDLFKTEKYQSMLDKLNQMYDRQDKIIEMISILKTEYDQLEQDKELLQTMIMHQANKDDKKKTSV